jgi:tetratricopeptide (TPR) repeat protein
MSNKMKARKALSAGKFQRAATLYTEAIGDGQYETALELKEMLALRATCFLELGKPAVAMRDVDKALALCPEW